jgi:4-diphosphocytidyl-2-C-methyl-D-erythritol kinase
MTDWAATKGKRQVGSTLLMRAPAKINLHLEVLKHRHDGYHEVETILQAVTLYDEVEVTLVEEFAGGEPIIQLTVAGNDDVPNDKTNLCWMAARKYCQQMRVSGKIVLNLLKVIPAGGGLGGGSSDAAAVLVALDRLFDKKSDPEDLERIGAMLGADVPFFIKGGTALGRGVGTELTQLPQICHAQFLIVKPAKNLDTSEVYGNLKMGLTVNSAKANIKVVKPLLARFPQENWLGFNRLEEVVLPGQPELQRLVLELREEAPVAMLSGSGSAVYAAYPREKDLSSLVAQYEDAGYFVRAVGAHVAGVEVKGN